MESSEAINPSSAEPQTPAETATDQPPAEQDEATRAAVEGASEGSGAEGQGASSLKKKAQRVKKGTVPPSLSLEEAATIITDYYEQTGGDQTTYDPLSSITNNSSGSSVFWRKLATMKNYGLIQEESRLLSLTPLGLRIAAPHDPAERVEALKQAFLNVEIFKNAYERYKGKILPLDQFLENAFTSYVPKELAAEWVEKFKSSAYAAGLLENRGGKVQVRESVIVPTPDKEIEKPPADTKGETTGQGQGDIKQPPDPPPLTANATRTPIPLGPGRLAYIELPEGWESKDLKKLLRLLTLALGEDSEESERILSSL
jgi:hypothetical protein